MVDIDATVMNYLRHAEVDYVGLWQISAGFQDEFGWSNHTAVRRATLDVVEKLISRGLMPGDYTKDGFTFWLGSKEALLERIRSEWDRLPDGVPMLGDSSCWFALRQK